MQNAAPAIPRLNIPAYDWWNEALHGVARAGLATVFPQAIGLAATWDTDLQRKLGDTISTEARAKYNLAIQRGQHGRYQGLTFWSPNINIFRDPRWGRGQETYGEDPFLTSEMAVAFINGLQGTDPLHPKVIATSKHFAVHSGPEKLRHGFDTEPSAADLKDTYLFAFERTVEQARVGSVMCAYNAVDHVPACANSELLQRDLRDRWHFGGYVVSDCGAIGDIYDGHHYTQSLTEASAKALLAGTDLSCGSEYRTLVDAVHQGLVSEQRITSSVERLFTARFRLGMFDPSNAYANIGPEQIASPAHAQLALEAAEESIVLLKNEHSILPLEKAPARIAVIGPPADDPDVMLGNYNGIPRHIVTPLEGIEREFKEASDVHFALGSVYAEASAALVPAAALQDLTAEYFHSTDFSGPAALKRRESRIYFDWDMQDAATVKALPEPTFSVRWAAQLKAPFTGDYQLGFTRQECDSCHGANSIRVFLNEKLLVEQTGPAAHGNQTKTAAAHLEAGRSYAVRVEYTQQSAGSGVELVWTPPADDLLQEAVQSARNSDLVIAVVGLNARLEGEESPIEIPGFDHGDRTDLKLPAPQRKLLTALFDTGKPVVVLLVNGSALAVSEAKQRAAAILESWYGGEAGGTAIANTLVGKNNPAGRLPVTFYESVDQLPPFTDYAMKGRTYRFFKGTPLYPFGYGLSYSEFRYSPLKSSGQTVSSHVTNISSRAGDEVVELYENGALKGFRRIHLKAAESSDVSFAIGPGVQPGSLWIGGHQR